MNHLTNEQMDDYLASRIAKPDHLKECATCRTRLAHRRALRTRVRGAFSSLQAGDAFRDRLQAALAKSRKNPPAGSATPAARRLYPLLAAAAALILAAVPATYFFTRTSQATAAQLELLEIHHHNLSEHGDLMTDLDPKSVEAYFREHLGYAPDIGASDAGLNYCGCRVQTYRGQAVGSYVVDTSNAKVTVVALRELPAALGLKQLPDLSSEDFILWGAICDCCHMAAIRTKGQTYYALGETSHEELGSVLFKLATTSN